MLVDRYEARVDAKSVQVSQIRMAPGLAYFPARVKGQFEAQYQILLDNRVHEGRVGYDVLTPFRIQNGHMRILVNRGWVPMGPSRSQLPVLETPGQVQIISGHLYRPPERYFSLEKMLPTLADKVWQNDSTPRRVILFSLMCCVSMSDFPVFISNCRRVTQTSGLIDIGVTRCNGLVWRW